MLERRWEEESEGDMGRSGASFSASWSKREGDIVALALSRPDQKSRGDDVGFRNDGGEEFSV